MSITERHGTCSTKLLNDKEKEAQTHWSRTWAGRGDNRESAGKVGGGEGTGAAEGQVRQPEKESSTRKVKRSRERRRREREVAGKAREMKGQCWRGRHC
ncbi:hypothetical protein ACFX13_040767 [Malus domestica]